MYDDNAVGGIVEDTSHAVMISRLARHIGPLCRRCGVRLTGYSKSNDVRRYAVTVVLSSQFIATIAQARAAHQPQSDRVHNAMLSVVLPQVQLTAVTIAQARAAHERVHKCNAISGISTDTARRCSR